MSKYRKIYEQHYGPIPKDRNGRSYEIHHIDGDHNNNDITNLKCVTIEEHYAIHYSQGDWAACLIMSDRMKISPEEKSVLSKKTQQELVDAGKHHWQQGTHNQKMLDEGIHPFADSAAATKRNNDRVNAGTHNLLKRPDGSSQAGDRVKSGEHHFVKNNPSKNVTPGRLLPAQIKLSCVFCKKRSSLNKFNRDHGNCGIKKI